MAQPNKPEQPERAGPAPSGGSPPDVQREIAELRAFMEQQLDRQWVALQGVAGLDGVATEVANIAAVLEPLRRLAPVPTVDGLGDQTAQALVHMRRALALEWDANGERVPRLPSAVTELAPVVVEFIGVAQDPPNVAR